MKEGVQMKFMNFLSSIFGRSNKSKILQRIDALEKANQERHRTVMAGQEDIVARLNAATALIDTLSAGIGEAVTASEETVSTITKVGTETEGLKQAVADLTAAVNSQDNAKPELVAAMAALETKLGGLGTAVDSAKTQAIAAKDKATEVDNKVPDATV